MKSEDYFTRSIKLCKEHSATVSYEKTPNVTDITDLLIWKLSENIWRGKIEALLKHAKLNVWLLLYLNISASSVHIIQDWAKIFVKQSINSNRT